MKRSRGGWIAFCLNSPSARSLLPLLVRRLPTYTREAPAAALFCTIVIKTRGLFSEMEKEVKHLTVSTETSERELDDVDLKIRDGDIRQRQVRTHIM